MSIHKPFYALPKNANHLVKNGWLTFGGSARFLLQRRVVAPMKTKPTGEG
ncbi:MAG: hypothetical protein WCH99_12920 [Verrucomicrobiota bacterium]